MSWDINKLHASLPVSVPLMSHQDLLLRTRGAGSRGSLRCANDKRVQICIGQLYGSFP